jgi:signal transduction histidine kinase
MQKSPAIVNFKDSQSIGFWAGAMLALQVVISLIGAVIFQSQAAMTLVTLDVIWLAAISVHFMLLRQQHLEQAGLTLMAATGAKAALAVLASPELFPVMALLPALAAGYVALQIHPFRGRLIGVITLVSYLSMLLAYRLAQPGNDLPRTVSDLLLLVDLPAGVVVLLHMAGQYRRRMDTTLHGMLHQNGVLKQTHNQMRHLLEVSRVISSHTDFNTQLNSVLEELQSTVPCDDAAVYLVDSDYRVTDCRIGSTHTHIAAHLARTRKLPSHHLRVLATEHMLLVSDATDGSVDARLLRSGLDEAAHETGHEEAARPLSWLGVPLLAQGKAIGLLTLSRTRHKAFSADEAHLAMAFANQVGAAIQSVRLKDNAIKAAAMTERARLSRDLHDSVSQSLFGVSLGVRTGLELLPPGAERAQVPIMYALDLAEAALTQMRSLIFELRPESLQEDGLIKALRRQAEGVIARYKSDCGSRLNINLCDREPNISLDAKEALYRISLEALQNAGKHAQAAEISLIMACDDDEVKLTIQDNGRGFDPHAHYPGHLGLKTMRERAGLFGGRVDIDSAPGRGTAITVVVPVDR